MDSRPKMQFYIKDGVAGLPIAHTSWVLIHLSYKSMDMHVACKGNIQAINEKIPPILISHWYFLEISCNLKILMM